MGPALQSQNTMKSNVVELASGDTRPLVLELLAQRQMYIVFQPIVDLQTRQIFANEALLRCKSPEFEGPLSILTSAVQSNCMGELGRKLREMTINSAPNCPLFLNVHPNEFDEGWLVRPDDPIFWHEQGVFLEITESVPLSHFQMCHSSLREIRSKGVFLAVDDLGAGYSNLKYIADLDPEIVKLDRELIAGLPKDKRQYQLVRSIVRLCTEMGARVVVEGIETRDELTSVIDCGAHYGQGFLLARPAYPSPSVFWP